MDERARQALADLVVFGEQASRLVARGKEAWDTDEVNRLAGEAILHKAGEAVSRLERIDPDILNAHPEVNWRGIKGARNIVAHRYHAVDYAILWNALSDRLPHDIAAARSILAQDGPLV
ncbi:DUF86 domain-containing protein [Knoellia sp. CPCC 206453]|uniref:HepT-like ribonuclease domain-containing protein n=1 Tax=Knoellia pratensis TaxID=3404796 RepID=UPI003606C9CC